MKSIKKDILICPNCKSNNLIFTETLSCQGCGERYSYNDKKIFFKELNTTDIEDNVDKWKFFFKRFPNLYSTFIYIFSPIYDNRKVLNFINQQVKSKNVIAINLGSGNTDLSDNITNVDIFNYENVNVVCDIESLPFADASVDLVINFGVLEHVPSPEKVVSEIFRILKQNGTVCSTIPFIIGFHASPYDFSRRTYEGMKVLYKDFETLKLTISGGPTSAFLWVFQEWVAILLSFGISPLYRIIYIVIMLLTFPLKFLDVILERHPHAKNIAANFLYIGRKK